MCVYIRMHACARIERATTTAIVIVLSLTLTFLRLSSVISFHLIVIVYFNHYSSFFIIIRSELLFIHCPSSPFFSSSSPFALIDLVSQLMDSSGNYCCVVVVGVVSITIPSFCFTSFHPRVQARVISSSCVSPLLYSNSATSSSSPSIPWNVRRVASNDHVTY